MLECKTSTLINGTGAKIIAMQEAWLVKAEGEAHQAGKLLWCLPFHLKGSTRTWAATDWNILQSAILLMGYSLRLVEHLQRHHPEVLEAVPYDGPPLGLPIFTPGGTNNGE